MQIVIVFRQIFSVVFCLAIISLVIISFREFVPKEEKEDKKENENVTLSNDEKWQNNLRILIAIVAIIIFIFFTIYGLINKKFLLLFFLICVPIYLEKMIEVIVSLGTVGNVVKSNDTGVLSFREHMSIFLVSGFVSLLQQGNCFEKINKFILKSCENIAADLLLIMLYVLTFFLYTFLICSQVPIIMLLTKKAYKKLIRYLPGKEVVKKYGDYFVERLEEPIKQSNLSISFIEMIKDKKTWIKKLCGIIVAITFCIDVVLFLVRVLWSIISSAFGYGVILLRLVKNVLKKLFNTIFNLSDKKLVAVSFRVAIILALVITVILNRYDVFVKNVDESTAVLEFLASSIIIPIVFEWIYSEKNNVILEKTKD